MPVPDPAPKNESEATSTYLTITDAAAVLRSGETTSVALANEAIAVADAHDEAVGTFIVRYTEDALAAAGAADAAFAAGRDSGPLQGIPLGIKDIISTKEGPSTAQSLVLDPQWGRDVGDAVVVSRLRQAGALIMGKLTTCEFAVGMPDFDRPFPIPRNPWNLDYWAGGSSSGSGSAVASGMVLGALGTDTGGSITNSGVVLRRQWTYADVRTRAQVRLRTFGLQPRPHWPTDAVRAGDGRIDAVGPRRRGCQ